MKNNNKQMKKIIKINNNNNKAPNVNIINLLITPMT